MTAFDLWQVLIQGSNMYSHMRSLIALFGLSLSLLAAARGVPQSGGDFSNNSEAKKLPTESILVKGAWSSASDSVTAVPEGGRVIKNVYSNAYFGFSYALSRDWTEKYSGPPPSDSGYYVLAQIRPVDSFSGTNRGSILIAASRERLRSDQLHQGPFERGLQSGATTDAGHHRRP
jgi:hypothetical protein